MQRGTPNDIGRFGQAGGAVRVGQMPFAVHVRIDAARYDDLAPRIDQPRALRHRQAAGRGHRDDALAGDRDVKSTDALRRDHGIATHHEIDHRCPPPVPASHRYARGPHAQARHTLEGYRVKRKRSGLCPETHPGALPPGPPPKA